jgi:hypothetical protein
MMTECLKSEEYLKSEELNALLTHLRKMPPPDARDFLGQVIAHRRESNPRLTDPMFRNVRFNELQHKRFLTDESAVRGSLRVFPHPDESEILLKYVKERRYQEETDCLIDLACGCGHTAMACSLPTRGALRVALDVNPRALQYALINRFVNEVDVILGLNNISDGLLNWVRCDAQRYLFTVNMPFAIDPFPKRALLPIASSSDQRGSKLTLAALRAMKEFAQHLESGRTARACVLAYSLLNEATDICDIPEQARCMFEPENVHWRLLEDARMWRVNGVKTALNPMPLEQLVQKAECRFDVPDDRRDEARVAYHSLANQLMAEGWTHLAYGILDIEL